MQHFQILVAADLHFISSKVFTLRQVGLQYFSVLKRLIIYTAYWAVYSSHSNSKKALALL